MSPSHGTRPKSSPPTHHSSSTNRPSSPLVTTASLTATNPRAAGLDVERQELYYLRLYPRRYVKQRPTFQLVPWNRAEEADPAEVDADHRNARPEEQTAAHAAWFRRRRARSRFRGRRHRSTTPVSASTTVKLDSLFLRDDASSRASPAPSASGRPWRTACGALDAAYRTASSIQRSSSMRSAGPPDCRTGGR